MALLEAVKAGEVAGYGTDVLSCELDENSDIASDPLVVYAKENRNVLITPHIGGMTADSRVATDVFMAAKVKKFVFGQ